MNVPAAKPPFPRKYPLLFAALLIFLGSCSVVKDYPAGQPFVYQTNIELQGTFSTDERKELVNRLNEQLHDSIQVRRLEKLIGWENGPRIFYNELRNPPVYDSLNADKSVVYMRALLQAQGYYRNDLGYDTTMQVVRDQQRTTVHFNVTPGKLIKLDSIAYNFRQDTLLDVSQTTLDTLRKVTQEAMAGSLLRKGEPFSKSLLAAELDRLSDVYRNNGYLRFSSEELMVLWDTVGLALLRPTLDPIEQAQQLEALRIRRENPTADIEIRLRPNTDTSHLTRYYVGNVTVYPDLTSDTARYVPVRNQRRYSTIISYHNLFKTRAIVENNYLRRGDLYSQRNYLKTLNRFNSIGAWRLATIDPIPRTGTDTVDFVVKLTPASKYIFDINLEGSQNWGSTFTAGNLVGINLGLLNRNFARGANQSNTNFRFGTELSAEQFVKTRQIAFGQTINFPRLIPRFRLPRALRENFRTTFSLNASLTARDTFFNVKAINASWGYEFNWKNKLLSFRIPNIEYAQVDVLSGLKRLIDSNATYRYIFNDGLVSSVISSLTVTGGRKDVTNFGRFNIEYSGLLPRAVQKDQTQNRLYRFIKLDADLRKTFTIRRSALAFRLFGGVGYGLPYYNTDSANLYLPFFKAYFAGGANSMRAWTLRKLGPGSSTRSFARNVAPERFGDMQLEFNAEYRFFLADIRGVLLNSALFTDIGNIWYLRNNPDFDNEEFRLKYLMRDLAIGAGTGLRIDFGLFLIRLDYAYKVKDPNLSGRTGEIKWFPDWKPLTGQFQLGVTYPF